MTRIAVFGAGRIGAVHARNLATIPGVKVARLVDPATDCSHLARDVGATVSSQEEVFADNSLDGVVIASSTDSHASLLKTASAAGLPIFCEKPISLDFETVLDVTSAVEHNGTPVMLGFQRRYDPNFRAVRERIAAGTSGRLEQLIMQTRDPSPPPLAYVRRSGGMLRDQAIHDFDQARYMLGEEIASVYAVGNCQFSPEFAAEDDIDSLMVTMLSVSGRMVQISNNRRGPLGYDQRLEAHCAKEVLFIENRPQTDIRIAGALGTISARPMDYFISRFAEAYRLEMVAFVDMIRDGGNFLASLRDGCEAQRLAEAALTSIRTGQPIQINAEWRPGN